jgi:hypothetical protein
MTLSMPKQGVAGRFGFPSLFLPAVHLVENSEAICYGAGVGGVVKIW